MNTAYLLLGSNLHDREYMIRKALEMIMDRIGSVRQVSSIYQSEPWGFEAKNHFLNQALVVDTSLGPEEILDEIIKIENILGRERDSNHAGYESRTIDIDILFYNDMIISGERLNIPHPHISERMFTLLPLCELNSSLVHPVLKKTVGMLKSECPDRNDVMIFQA